MAGYDGGPRPGENELVSSSERGIQFPEQIILNGSTYTWVDGIGQGILGTNCLYRNNAGDQIVVKAPILNLPEGNSYAKIDPLGQGEVNLLTRMAQNVAGANSDLDEKGISYRAGGDEERALLDKTGFRDLAGRIRLTMREAAIVALLNDAEAGEDRRSIVKHYDLQFHDGWPLFVMEYVPYVYNPEKFIDFERLKEPEGFLIEIDRILESMIGVAQAMAVAHQSGFVLNDLDPGTKHDRFRCHAVTVPEQEKLRLTEMRVIDWNATDIATPELIVKDMQLLGLHFFYLATGRFLDSVDQYLNTDFSKEMSRWNALPFGVKLIIDNLVRKQFSFLADQNLREEATLTRSGTKGGIATVVLTTLRQFQAAVTKVSGEGCLSIDYIISTSSETNNQVLKAAMADLAIKTLPENGSPLLQGNSRINVEQALESIKSQAMDFLNKRYWIRLADARTKILIGVTNDLLVGQLDAIIREAPPILDVSGYARALKAQVLTNRQLNTKGDKDLFNLVQSVTDLVTKKLYQEAADFISEPANQALQNTPLHKLVHEYLSQTPDFVPAHEARQRLIETTEALAAARQEIAQLQQTISNQNARLAELESSLTHSASSGLTSMETISPPEAVSVDLANSSPPTEAPAAVASLFESVEEALEQAGYEVENFLTYAQYYSTEIIAAIENHDAIVELLINIFSGDNQATLHEWLQGTTEQKQIVANIIYALDERVERAVGETKQMSDKQELANKSIALVLFVDGYQAIKAELYKRRAARAARETT